MGLIFPAKNMLQYKVILLQGKRLLLCKMFNNKK